MLQFFKKKRREGGLLKITTSNINSAQCFQVLLLWRLHPTAGVSNGRGSQLCFPLWVFSCCCLSSVAPPHMLEHMRVPASVTHVNRTGPDVGAKVGALRLFTSLLPRHGETGEKAPARASAEQLSFISPRVGEVLCKAPMEDLWTGWTQSPFRLGDLLWLKQTCLHKVGELQWSKMPVHCSLGTSLQSGQM